LAKPSGRDNLKVKEHNEMTIHLPEYLENPILEAVHSGRYASLNDAMAEAASLLVQRLKQEQAQAKPPAPSQGEGGGRAHKPIWERILERCAAISDEEWDKLPVDGAEQHDHYIYGVPTRPPSP
jgi:Arc/MetJ-type ribon-helix-helix transcriptional regulator